MPADLLEAHKNAVATRALQRIMRSRNTSPVSQNNLREGELIWIFYNISAHNVPKQWIQATVIEATPFLVKCRRSNRGPPMNIAYEHVHLVPKGELARELQRGILQDMLENRDEGTEDENAYIFSSLMDHKNINEMPELDIGSPTETKSIPVNTKLHSDEQRVLNEMYQILGNEPVSRSKLEFVPQWIITKAIKEEIEKAWLEAYVEITECDVPLDANII